MGFFDLETGIGVNYSSYGLEFSIGSSGKTPDKVKQHQLLTIPFSQIRKPRAGFCDNLCTTAYTIR